MPRIIAGAARGRPLRVPTKGTRPTSDRVREALYSALESRMDFADVRVLDLFAGSGALGLEALSRGAHHVTAVEHHAKAAALIRTNARETGLKAVDVLVMDAGTWAAEAAGHGREDVDLAFLDPPYDYPLGKLEALLAVLTDAVLAEDAFVVVERSARTPAVAWPSGFTELLSRDYGETRIQLARFDGPAPVDSPA